MTTPERQFLEAIVEDPEARFIFADWLEENGDKSKAGFWRGTSRGPAMAQEIARAILWNLDNESDAPTTAETAYNAPAIKDYAARIGHHRRGDPSQFWTDRVPMWTQRQVDEDPQSMDD